MNHKMKGFIELAQVDFAQAMELMPYIPGAKEAILMHTFPGKNSNHRKFFLNAAKDPETDPEILHAIGIRDLPTKIRFAVISNPSTERRTIEKMARQSANDTVTRRAEKFLQTNPESPKGDIMESDNPYLNKILKIMETDTDESAVQALELAASFGLEDEVLKRIPPVSEPRFSGRMSLTGIAGKSYTPPEIIVKLYNEAMDVLSGKSPTYSTGVKLPNDNWIFEGYLFQIAYNKGTPKDLLIELAKYDKDPPYTSEYHAASVRIHVTYNKNPPKEALMILANDKEDDIRRNARSKLGAPIEESKLKLSTKDIRKIIKEELRKVLLENYNPMVAFMDDVLQATMTADYQTIMNAMKKNAMLLHSERSELGEFKESHRKQLLDMFAESVYRYQKSYGMEGLERLVELAEDIKFEYQSHDDKDIDEEPPF